MCKRGLGCERDWSRSNGIGSDYPPLKGNRSPIIISSRQKRLRAQWAELYPSTGLFVPLFKVMYSSYFKAVFFFSLIAAVFGVSCSTEHQPKVTQGQAANSTAAEVNRGLATLAQTTTPSSADYQIGPEDLLQITLYNVDADTRTPRVVNLRVSNQGLISLPLIGEIKVSGLTSSGLEKELQKRYEKYIYNPQVAVLVSDYKQQVSVMGAVLRPGSLPLTGPKTVIDILGIAGGVTDRAGTQVHIYRQGPNGRETYVIDLLVLASNASLINENNATLITMPLQGGDIINVPPAGMFFVQGAVKSPGSFPLGRRYSLTQALATAGGVDPDLNASEITIFRGKGQPVTVDLQAILAGSVSDPPIEADDVIVVPISNLKYVYYRVFGTVLGWGLSIGSIAHGS
jgi:polysaccharide biosynthesis/export protein